MRRPLSGGRILTASKNMKRTGNVASNRIFNPQNIKASIPVDIDEVDGAIERFIRQKYEQRVFTAESRPGTRQNTGSTSSDDRGPPLPPKPTKRFGFGLRASSSTFPVSRGEKPSPPVSPSNGPGSPTGQNKASRVFGSNLGGSDAGFESKLAVLREMGFQDEKRNATVLRGLNGNVDKAVETLIRLGEGNGDRSRSRTPTAPLTPGANPSGITFDRDPPKPPAESSTNPFDMLDKVQTSQPAPFAATQQPQSAFPSQPTGSSYNPFLNPTQVQPPPAGPGLEQSFQNLTVSQQPAQRLFPNSTGGYGNQPPNQQGNPYLQTYTPPPVPQLPPQYGNPISQQSAFAAPQSNLSPQATGSNPFLRTARSQIFAPSNPFDQNSASGPFAPSPVQPTGMQGGPFGQPAQPQQPQPTGIQSSPFGQPAAQLQQPQPTGFNPSYSNPYLNHSPQPPQQQWSQPEQPQLQQQAPAQLQQQPQQPQQPQFHQQQQQQQAPNNMQWPPQQLQQQELQQQLQPQQSQYPQPHWAPAPLSNQPPQPPIRHDKTSIMALYSHANPAATAPTTPQASNPADHPFAAPQRSVTMPVSLGPGTGVQSGTGHTPGAMNPFASAVTPGSAPIGQQPLQQPQQPSQPPPPGAIGPAAGAPVGNPLGGPSRESVDFAGLMGGRTSPDAFAGLSARYVR
jgi:hypothetical protein